MFLSPPFFHLPRRNFICTRISGSPANVLPTRCYDSCLVRKTNFLAVTDKIPRRLEEGYCIPSVERPKAALCIMHPAWALQDELVCEATVPAPQLHPANPLCKTRDRHCKSSIFKFSASRGLPPYHMPRWNTSFDIQTVSPVLPSFTLPITM